MAETNRRPTNDPSPPGENPDAGVPTCRRRRFSRTAKDRARGRRGRCSPAALTLALAALVLVVPPPISAAARVEHGSPFRGLRRT